MFKISHNKGERSQPSRRLDRLSSSLHGDAKKFSDIQKNTTQNHKKHRALNYTSALNKKRTQTPQNENKTI